MGWKPNLKAGESGLKLEITFVRRNEHRVSDDGVLVKPRLPPFQKVAFGSYGSVCLSQIQTVRVPVKVEAARDWGCPSKIGGKSWILW